MAYSADVDNGYRYYQIEFTHTPTNVQVVCQIKDIFPAPGIPTPAQRDAVFQALVTKIAELPGVVIDSATRDKHFTATVTP